MSSPYMQQPTEVTVLGAGSWGTALSIQLARKGHQVTLWGHRPDHVARIAHERENRRYLPGTPIPDNLATESGLNAATADRDVVVVAVPSHAFRTTLIQLRPAISERTVIVWATKGVERHSHKLLHQVIEEELGAERTKALISGPTFAKEVAAGLPTAVTIASDRLEDARPVAELFHSETFRCYTSSDIPGVEVGGATKNVLAIAAGIADGLGFGANSRAALITRGLHELVRLGLTLGGEPETFMGLGGLGDLVLTCTDDQSRNRRLGLAIGRGETVESAIAEIGQVVEGVEAAREIHQMAMERGVEMPITEQVAEVLHHGKDPHAAVHDLLQRDLTTES